MQIAALVLCFVFLTENDCVWVCAYAIILSPVALVVRFLLHHADLDGIPTRLIGPVFFAVAVLLGCFAKLDTGGGDEPEDPQATPPEVAATNAPPSVDGEAGAEEEAELPPGIRYTPPEENAVTVEEALAELDSLIGLGEVKDEVRKFSSFVRVAQQRQAAGLKVAPISYHMVFTGNPGTGKTTVCPLRGSGKPSGARAPGMDAQARSHLRQRPLRAQPLREGRRAARPAGLRAGEPHEGRSDDAHGGGHRSAGRGLAVLPWWGRADEPRLFGFRLMV